MSAPNPGGPHPVPETVTPTAGPTRPRGSGRPGRRARSAAYGLAFLLVVATLLGLSVATFQRRFTPVVLVTLEAGRAGSQLQESSDVKLRGIVVGQVRSITATATGARLRLALQPEEVAQIPADVTARILPKTLFGERFVQLVPGPRPSRRHLQAGDVITRDRSAVAIELETVLDNLDPLLRTVAPAQLATTLGALATSLDGRGERLGDSLSRLDRYLAALEPSLPDLRRDLGLLARTADGYADATPDLLRLTDALAVTSATLAEKDQRLAEFLVGTAGFANEAAGFLRDNERRIIQVGRVGRPTLALLARYSPIYPCLAEGLSGWLPRIDEAFSGGTFHITLEVVPPRKPYHPGEEPRWGAHNGPHCYGLPDSSGSQRNPAPGRHFADGTDRASEATPALPAALLGSTAADSGLAGTTAEQRLVGALLAGSGGSGGDAGDGSGGDAGANSGDGSGTAEPSAIQTLLAGPMLRGTVVNGG